jgi:hypothetical protein
VRSPRWRPARPLAVFALAAWTAGAGGAASDDPLASEIARWQTFAATHPSRSEMWSDVQTDTRPVLSSAADSLAKGQRALALQRLASARIQLAAFDYLDARPPTELDSAAFEAEWKRMGEVLRADLVAPKLDALAGVRPAVSRALAEAALLQVRAYYEAGLDFGRNTMARDGLFYVGAAQAQRDFVALAGTLLPPSPKPLPPLRSFAPELDAFEDTLLAAYVPPASIDRHPDFIAASASLKEARELDAAGLRYGALYKYLQAAQRLPVARDEADAPGRLAALEKRLDESPFDASIGRLYLEIARADLAAQAPGKSANAAAAIADDVLPRYFSALAPAPRPNPPPHPRAEVTVTLVRWPYT